MRPLVANHIEGLAPYVPGSPAGQEVLQLNSNENVLGPSPRALAAAMWHLEQSHLYPDAASTELTRRLAEHLGVATNQLVLGNGSNELIELLIRTFTGPDDETLLCRGSFLMYRVALQAHGRRFTEVPMREGHRYDLEAMAKALTPRTRMVFLANPDNPTGTAFTRSELEDFLTEVGPETLVVLDEAYFEFVDWDEYPNGLDYVPTMPNVVVLRTFSKIYGLAGFRVGYGVADAKVAEYLNRTRMPYNVSSIAQAAAAAALDDSEHLSRTRLLTHHGLRYLERELGALGAEVPRSHANFVFADFERPAGPIHEALAKRGVLVRPMRGYGFPNALRISVGRPHENARVIDALSEVLAGQNSIGSRAG